MHYGQHRKRSSPRSWGCFLNGLCEKFTSPCLPHARGGVSFGAVEADPATVSSPRSWGCFQPPYLEKQLFLVFPTLVGVFPTTNNQTANNHGLPHARGGVSASVLYRTSYDTSSPRSWGCFLLRKSNTDYSHVFPTLVGVFLSTMSYAHP